MTDKTPGSPRDKRHQTPESFADIQAQIIASQAEIHAQFKHAKDQLDATNERIKTRSGRDLVMAIVIGVALGVGMLFSLIVVKEVFVLFAAVLVAFASIELSGALRAAGRDVPRLPTVTVSVLLMPVAFYLGFAWLWVGFLAALVIVSVWRLVEYATPRGRTTPKDLGIDLLTGGLVILYVPLLASFAVILTAQPGGQWWTLSFLILTIVSDVGAYAIGLNFGRHRMAPRISPKKSWEGFAGSVGFGIVAGILLTVFMLGQEWWVGVIVGVSIVLTATLGDLIESMIKRDIGIKDMSSWLPGHGGFLDRLDSILPSALVAFVLYLIFA